MLMLLLILVYMLFIVIGVYVDAAVVNEMDVVYLLLLMFGYAAVHTGMSVIYCCWCFC